MVPLSFIYYSLKIMTYNDTWLSGVRIKFDDSSSPSSEIFQSNIVRSTL